MATKLMIVLSVMLVSIVSTCNVCISLKKKNVNAVVALITSGSDRLTDRNLFFSLESYSFLGGGDNCE